MASMGEKQQIPVINFAGVEMSKKGSERWKEVATQVFQALQLYGCFQALHEHVFTPELRAELLSSVRDEVFSLPQDSKLRDTSEKTFHEYAGPKQGFDADTFAINNPIPLGIPSFVNYLWEQSDNPKFREVAQLYTQKAVDFEEMVRRMVVEELGVTEKHALELAESTCYSLRFWEYGRQVANKEEAVPKAHKDLKLLAVLWQLNDVDGLEVQSKEGDWIPATLSSSSSLMVHAGSSLMAWSNGRIYAPLHQVMVNKNQESIRYSVIVFSATNDEFIIEAPEELVDKEHPRLFTSYTLLELLKFKFSEEGKKLDCPLTTKFRLNS